MRKMIMCLVLGLAVAFGAMAEEGKMSAEEVDTYVDSLYCDLIYDIGNEIYSLERTMISAIELAMIDNTSDKRMVASELVEVEKKLTKCLGKDIASIQEVLKAALVNRGFPKTELNLFILGSAARELDDFYQWARSSFLTSVRVDSGVLGWEPVYQELSLMYVETKIKCNNVELALERCVAYHCAKLYEKLSE
ncbi:MAG: hypothetical protein HDR54_03660 [Treponema sp.]|nr:hypothetical protein [Treponema sp.]